MTEGPPPVAALAAHLATVRSPVKRVLIGQFMKPHGILGIAAGWIMASRESNRKRNLWTVDLMELEPSHRVLEVGHGPGFALEQVGRRLDDGVAAGLDHSRTMHNMARARNRKAVANGRLELRLNAVEDMEHTADAVLQGPFDRIFAVNAVMLWTDPPRVHGILRERLRPGGRIHLTYQPRTGDRTDAASLAAADSIQAQLVDAGYGEVRVETLRTVSPMAVCVIGTRGET